MLGGAQQMVHLKYILVQYYLQVTGHCYCSYALGNCSYALGNSTADKVRF